VDALGGQRPGAFDGKADFAAHDVISRHAELAGIPVFAFVGRQLAGR
jgi:hypothetical protein